ncbi:MAG: hypothetical protein HY422_03445 [Candidatus Komeilibacteria bacterium]|nr:hypothetical protein [Candidatus Komeilibacteria bacterium]
MATTFYGHMTWQRQLEVGCEVRAVETFRLHLNSSHGLEFSDLLISDFRLVKNDFDGLVTIDLKDKPLPMIYERELYVGVLNPYDAARKRVLFLKEGARFMALNSEESFTSRLWYFLRANR